MEFKYIPLKNHGKYLVKYNKEISSQNIPKSFSRLTLITPESANDVLNDIELCSKENLTKKCLLKAKDCIKCEKIDYLIILNGNDEVKTNIKEEVDEDNINAPEDLLEYINMNIIENMFKTSFN